MRHRIDREALSARRARRAEQQADYERRQHLEATEMRAVKAWWTAYQTALTDKLSRVKLPGASLRDIAWEAETDFRQRVAEQEAAVEKIWEGFDT